jgi:hypothetical protein
LTIWYYSSQEYLEGEGFGENTLRTAESIETERECIMLKQTYGMKIICILDEMIYKNKQDIIIAGDDA